jgi:hypothetical protein
MDAKVMSGHMDDEVDESGRGFDMLVVKIYSCNYKLTTSATKAKTKGPKVIKSIYSKAAVRPRRPSHSPKGVQYQVREEGCASSATRWRKRWPRAQQQIIKA